MGNFVLVTSCLSLLVIKHNLALPTSEVILPPPVSERSRVDSRLLEARINPNGSQLQCTTNDDFQIQSGVINEKYRWENFNVFIESDYSKDERTLINNAMYRLSQVLPCVNFGIYPEDSTPSGDYVNIVKGGGCSSSVGRVGGEQDLTLASPGCMSIGTIMHEMIHALGFHHEQCRPDRDDYVTIQSRNIESGKEHNFRKYSSRQVSTFGVAYDQRSIMHYGSKAFSKNGQPTIVAKNGGSVGSTGELRESDKSKLKNMYEC